MSDCVPFASECDEGRNLPNLVIDRDGKCDISAFNAMVIIRMISLNILHINNAATFGNCPFFFLDQSSLTHTIIGVKRSCVHLSMWSRPKLFFFLSAKSPEESDEIYKNLTEVAVLI